MEAPIEETEKGEKTMKLEKGSKLLMIGDSVTDCDRLYDAIPAGWGSFGNGYVNLVNACLTGLAPEYRIAVYNKGISGNTVVDLQQRWQQDVLDLKPDYVSVMIGINDVWRHFDAVMQPMEKVDEEMFRNTYEELIQKTKPVVKQMYLIGAFMMIETKDYPMRKMVERYANITKELAKKYELPYIDVQARMDAFMENLPAYTLSNDHVHPNVQGHMIVAKAFLDEIGFEWR